MIGVTGVTGHLGGQVAQLLRADGVPFAMLARRPDSVADPVPDVRHCVYGDPESALMSLTGVTTLLMVSASESPTRVEEHRALIDAAAGAGVEHIVYTSFAGAAPDAVFTLARDHYATEEHLRSAGPAYTILRDNLYLDFLVTLPGPDGVIRAPAGDGRVAAIARRDVARVATRILTDPAPHRNSVYELTGPEALSFDTLAEILSRARGELITFRDESIEEAYAYRRKWAAPQWQYDAWVSTYTAIAAGQMSSVSGDVERISGGLAVSLDKMIAASDSCRGRACEVVRLCRTSRAHLSKTDVP
ncbi:conserved hypothetical protein [uncultured Mycobacterium sp.]|uniref:NAD(P)-binding domain-containing protein n=1 Tax=uncultured Mycobacterium sp. TaxID=171292 RepID=A0A1Y5PTX6_9MYCO|nr:conserved hypothetical protein [uncultured Mycobacterium sp.]